LTSNPFIGPFGCTPENRIRSAVLWSERVLPYGKPFCGLQIIEKKCASWAVAFTRSKSRSTSGIFAEISPSFGLAQVSRNHVGLATRPNRSQLLNLSRLIVEGESEINPKTGSDNGELEGRYPPKIATAPTGQNWFGATQLECVHR